MRQSLLDVFKRAENLLTSELFLLSLTNTASFVSLTMKNPVEGRVIVEVTRRHIVIYQCDQQGMVTDQDVFAWGFTMDRKDAVDEVSSTYGYLYDFLNHTINGEDDDEAEDSADPENDSGGSASKGDEDAQST